MYDFHFFKMVDNFNTMTRGIIRFLFTLFLCLICAQTFAKERIGIVSDAVLTNITPYNTYFRTPEFFLQDVRGRLLKRNVSVVSVETLKTALKNANIRQTDLEALMSLQQGYDLDYALLKKIARSIGVKKLVVMTSAIDIQRDFLKNTLWNAANIPSMDVVNPTHRVSVYVAFVDVQNEVVIWEQIYAKNIRNNKFKNAETTISNNYEGMLRLKEYSKYISPEIAQAVDMRLIDPNYVTPVQDITRHNTLQYWKDMKNMGSRKRLTDLELDKWNKTKLRKDSTERVKNVGAKIKSKFKKGESSIIEGTKEIYEDI